MFKKHKFQPVFIRNSSGQYILAPPPPTEGEKKSKYKPQGREIKRESKGKEKSERKKGKKMGEKKKKGKEKRDIEKNIQETQNFFPVKLISFPYKTDILKNL